MRTPDELVRLRQQGRGVWIISYIVMGYDETFVMHAPGEWDEDYAIMKTKVALANRLRVFLKLVELKDTKMETP